MVFLIMEGIICTVSVTQIVRTFMKTTEERSRKAAVKSLPHN